MWKQGAGPVVAATIGELGCSRAVDVESGSAGAVAAAPVNARTALR